MVLPARAAVDDAHHVLGRKHDAGVEIEAFCSRLVEIDGRLGGVVFGVAVDRIDQVLVDKILRGEFEVLGVGAFPGRRAQIAGRHFAFAGVEFGDLAEIERIALAGIAAEIIDDAAAARRQSANCRAFRQARDRRSPDAAQARPARLAGIWRASCAGAAQSWRQEQQAEGNDGGARCQVSSTTMNLSRSARFGDGPRLPFSPVPM